MTTTREAVLEAALRYYADDANGNDGWTADQSVARAALAARPAPQPAADTRVVTVSDLEAWLPFLAWSEGRDKIRAIIWGAKP